MMQTPQKNMRKSNSYHRRSLSCVPAPATDGSYRSTVGRFFDEASEGELSDGQSASPARRSRHMHRKSESGVIVEGDDAASTDPSDEARDSMSKLSLGGKLGKVNVVPATGARRSLLSEALNSQASPNRLEQNAQRRRVLKSMRRYSMDVSEMNFNIAAPNSRSPGMPSVGEGATLMDGRQEFRDVPTVRYLRNPYHAAVKTKLQSSAFRTPYVSRRGGEDDAEAPDWFAEDRVW
ncbi:hypothetical protein DFQ27_000284 [Actinomortierella ambigua]|uniref:Uncharacterized protein n=1 Tax=Actinomortierella ambigua TaxID=1343610 RepID=A0A9P6QHX4_9FUNG|nr:hypothetical protein DFQ26_001768 [Actinomortierella ambigua]KAG0265920.1 hypothetical protein DFQ27_000284 [Actinomortierella ambigua]